jgi:glycosyltransferase involved in cell wall biosynthesis
MAAACTVAIPAYNQETFIDKAIRSALDQDVPGLEIIVVDDASTDGTWKMLQGFAQQGVRLHRNERNLGLFGNFNRCLDLADAPYVRLLLGDDALASNCLARELDLMERHPDVAMLNTRGVFVDPAGRSLGAFADVLAPGVYDGARFAREWLEYYVHYRRNLLNYPSGVLFRRSAMQGLRFDESMRTAGDIEFYMAVLRHGNLAADGDVGCYVTRHPKQAHVGPNMDGTAMRELLVLLERNQARDLHDQFAGMCIAVAIQRRLRGFAPSARIHMDLALSVASSRMAALAGFLRLLWCRFAEALLGARAPHVPRTVRAL